MESIDDYLNTFRQLKTRCFTQLPKHKLVWMVVGGLEYFIRKELVNQKLRDMAHLVDKVWRIEQLKFKKERNGKFDKFP